MRTTFLSVLLVVAGAGSASAQYGNDDLRSIARSLDNIEWDLFSQGLRQNADRIDSYGGGSGYSGSYYSGVSRGYGSYSEPIKPAKGKKAKRVRQPKIRMYTYYSNGPLWMW
jgi:hypothetical protein